MNLQTRADLSEFDGFSHLDVDTSGNPCVFNNHYRCLVCVDKTDLSSQPTEWEEAWSCQCNSKCPNCGAEHEPYDSDWLASPSTIAKAMWSDLPEAA